LPLRRQGQPAAPAQTPLQSKGVAYPADFDVVGAASYICACRSVHFRARHQQVPSGCYLPMSMSAKGQGCVETCRIATSKAAGSPNSSSALVLRTRISRLRDAPCAHVRRHTGTHSPAIHSHASQDDGEQCAHTVAVQALPVTLDLVDDFPHALLHTAPQFPNELGIEGLPGIDLTDDFQRMPTSV